MPKYREEAKNIALPTREKIQMLIANAGKLLQLKLQLSMETGLRPVELARLKVKDIDLDHKTVNPTTAKKGNPRTIPMSANPNSKTPRTHNKEQPNTKRPTIQRNRLRPIRKTIPQNEKRTSRQTQRPNNHDTIRLYDLRHYFCTKKLNDIGNPYTVMVLMGHTKLTTTQRYMHLLNLNDDEWTCTGATTAKEATKLIEAGFQYVTTIEGIQLFKKRK